MVLLVQSQPVLHYAIVIPTTHKQIPEVWGNLHLIDKGSVRAVGLGQVHGRQLEVDDCGRVFRLLAVDSGALLLYEQTAELNQVYFAVGVAIDEVLPHLHHLRYGDFCV